MRFLTTRRRHRAAKPLLLAFALLVMGAFYVAVSPAPQVSADAGTSGQVAAGKNLFAVTCSSCHGLNGEGTKQGPSLVGVGAAAVDFQMSTGRMPMAHPGAQAPRRVNTYTAEEIAALSAYVATLGPGPSIPNSSAYDYSKLTDEDLARGGELFRTNCSACHNASGIGGALPEGKYAPSLHGVEPLHIYEAMRTGPQQMPVFSAGAIPDHDVASIIGYLKNLEKQPSAGFSLGSIGPVSEGLFGWIIGIGGLSLFAVWIASRGARAR
ncbi:cytochrome bc1 complex diheme cytochrome c subunit [Nigerium massiliense]|uniref:cytochrome bc1 complex diheme cytochrome c subunit n=1 Tax=Nigerium massiliense TaxID=1522317 RepID=UPI00058CE4BF|nr:cytochrome c [Nigerium massiliense]